MRKAAYLSAVALFVTILASTAGAAELEKREFTLAEVPLTLEQAVDTALGNNRRLRQADSDLTTAERKVTEMKAKFGPSLSLDGNWQRVHDSSSFTSAMYMPQDISGYFATASFVTNPVKPPVYTASPMPTLISIPLSARQSRTMDLTFALPLHTFGVRGDSIRLIRRDRDAKELEIRRVELEVTLKTCEAFFNYMLAKRSAEVMAESLKLREDHLAAARKMEEQGQIPNFDVIRAEVDVAKAREDLSQAETGRDLSRMALNNVLGLPVDRATETRFDLSGIGIPSLSPAAAYIEAALANRVEMRQMELGLEQTRIGARLSRNRPMVALAVLRNVLSAGSAFSSEDTWRYVVNYSTNLFDSGAAHAKVAQAKQAEARLSLQDVDLREGIILQTRQAYLNLNESGRRLETSRAIMTQATKARQMADVGREQGVTSEIDWKDAMMGEVMAGLNLARAEYDLEMSKAKLANAVGAGSFDELTKLVSEK